jgi:hypothetical protein
MKELGDRARRLLCEKGRKWNQSTGVAYAADVGGVVIAMGTDGTLNLHLPDETGKWGKTIYCEHGRRRMLFIDEAMDRTALERLRGIQVLDDLADV